MTEEVVSEIDINAEFTLKGLSVSVYVDEVEVHHNVDYKEMATMMASDKGKYPDEILMHIRDGLVDMIDILDEGVTYD